MLKQRLRRIEPFLNHCERQAGTQRPPRPLQTVQDVIDLLQEQVEAIRAEPASTTIDKARAIAYLAGVAQKAIAAGVIGARRSSSSAEKPVRVKSQSSCWSSMISFKSKSWSQVASSAVLFVGDAIRLHLFRCQTGGDVHRDGFQPQLEGSFVAGVADHDHSLLVDHDGLTPPPCEGERRGTSWELGLKFRETAELEQRLAAVEARLAGAVEHAPQNHPADPTNEPPNSLKHNNGNNHD